MDGSSIFGESSSMSSLGIMRPSHGLSGRRLKGGGGGGGDA